MRLIDADALIHELNNSHYPGAPYVDAGISIAIGKVCDAPTIEPSAQPTTEPEEEFEEDETWAIVFREKDTRAMVYGCPVCGEAFMEKDHCPNCGAIRKENR